MHYTAFADFLLRRCDGVGAGANVLSFGRFQNAEGFATALA